MSAQPRLLLFGTAAISFLNLRVTQRNVEIAESKQVTDRFSKAVEMLGSENSIHILGGIAALERLCKLGWEKGRCSSRVVVFM